MNSQEIYQEHGQELYLFILKKVKNKHIANDVFQSTFLKIHKHIEQLKAVEKARSWVFQITRNEIANFFNQKADFETLTGPELDPTEEEAVNICCFDRFINELPDTYKEVIQLTYLSGKKQEEVAALLNISLSNVKARISRSKAMLKERFLDCCKYETNLDGKLIGAPNCAVCK